MAKSVITFLQNKGGYATMKEFKEEGIHTRNVRKALEKGFIVKLKPGLYKMRDYPRDKYENFIDIHTAYNKARVCLTSALAHYELTTFNPPKITVAVPNNSTKINLKTLQVDTHFYRENIYETGVTEVERSYGSFKVYNKPKTICDMFHYRNQVGEDLAFEGLKNYLKQPDANLNEVQKYMKICRVKTIMKPYIKVLVS